MYIVKDVYKIFVIEKNELRNLFRGIEGTRTIKYDQWLEADKKWGVDSSGQDPYLTGFHVLQNYKDAKEYLETKFRTEKLRVIVECKAKNLRHKPTNKKVRLADYLYVPSKNVNLNELRKKYVS